MNSWGTRPKEIEPSRSRQREYYNRIAVTYDQHYASEENLRYRKYVFEQVFGKRDLGGLRVLDAMCGGGENSTYFVARGCEVTGVDISEQQCALYAQRFPGNACCADRSSILVLTMRASIWYHQLPPPSSPTPR